MIPHARVISVILLTLVLWGSEGALAQQYNALAQCRAQSAELDQVHACMDEYLDAMDASIDSMTDYLERSLSGAALSGLENSQQAFVEYRRENCLWYLDFSSPRVEAEQIAKNCLASMSRHRLQELQSLVSDDAGSGQIMVGYYVYGAERNSFQPCGREEKYWVEGAPDAVGLLQQNYLSVATSDRQLLHVTLAGNINTQLQAPASHQGVLQLSSLIEVRVPTDSDCSLSSQALSFAPASIDDTEIPEQALDVPAVEVAEQEEPEQQLTAYFGAWIVDCLEITGRKSCSLEVALAQGGAAAREAGDIQPMPSLVLNRTPQQGSNIELSFPGREIDSPTLIRWQIDDTELGDIVGSEIRVDQLGARQLVAEGPFLSDDLVPMMIGGQNMIVTVLESVDDDAGEFFTGTLLGLTKALNFADSFVRADG